MRHQPFTIILHVALAVILAGAFVTHFSGVQGKLTLYSNAAPVHGFEKESGPGNGMLPFSVSLDKVEIDYYPATTTPMNFRSVLVVDDCELTVAMNEVGEYKGWRFYQSGISSDSSTLTISHDPWGICITYTGYFLLAIGMIGFFFQPGTSWRALLRQYRRGVPATALLFLASFQGYAAEPHPSDHVPLPTMQRPLAANFGKVLVCWNDRICPIQTMARDVTTALYGSDSYMGYTAEQVLSGWLFYFDRWQRDYFLGHPELKPVLPYPESKKEKKMAERLALVNWIGTGEIFRIYPYHTVDGHIEWLSLTGRRPSGMDLEQWQFMQTNMQEMKRLLLRGKNTEVNRNISTLIERQREYAKGVTLPSYMKVDAERWYNRLVRPAIGGAIAICVGLLALLLPFCRPIHNRVYIVVTGLAGWLLLLYIAAGMAALWWISGHVPLSNGPETMMFMALVSLVGVCCCRDLTIRGGLLVVTAMSLFVAAMGGRTPAIGSMMPVLASPLLSIHVMVIMISYALFFLMSILALISLSVNDKVRSHRLTLLNRIMLTPAVCLLGAGIFIGAVWANQTWGRYWGWDPKETCALIMWLIYAYPVHWATRRPSVGYRGPASGNGRLAVVCHVLSPAIFRKDRTFNIYLVAAVLSVIFTYFGANYLLGGLHSYA